MNKFIEIEDYLGCKMFIAKDSVSVIRVKEEFINGIPSGSYITELELTNGKCVEVDYYNTVDNAEKRVIEIKNLI